MKSPRLGSALMLMDFRSEPLRSGGEARLAYPDWTHDEMLGVAGEKGAKWLDALAGPKLVVNEGRKGSEPLEPR